METKIEAKTEEAANMAKTAKAGSDAGKERIIYNNYDLDENYEEAKALLKEGSGEEPSDQSIWAQIYEDDKISWEDEKAQLESFFETRTFVLRGTTGRWNGNFDSGAVIRSFNDLCPAWKDCDYLKLYDVDGRFLIQASHHDGTNSFELRELTREGIGFLTDQEWEMPDRKLHETLWKAPYSRVPDYAHLVYGCAEGKAV